MNILILSAGTRNKVVQYFRRALAGRGRVIAADMSPLAPALYEADGWGLTPPMRDPGYLEAVFELCRREKIDGVLSLIDPELSLLAAQEAAFSALGVKLIGSGYDLCELSLNKYHMYQWLKEHGYGCAATFTELDSFLRARAAGEIDYPVIVKPICGSASLAVTRVEGDEMLRALYNSQKELMIQEYERGQEIGADVYVDLISGEVVSIFTKKKIKMRAGETDKAVSFRDEKLFSLISRFVKEAGFRGPVDIDLFETSGGYHISEVNPRFGGGYPHAYECGCDHMKLIIENLAGRVNPPRIGAYEEGVVMMKYSEIKMLHSQMQGV